jgi:hypothetical protein
MEEDKEAISAESSKPLTKRLGVAAPLDGLWVVVQEVPEGARVAVLNDPPPVVGNSPIQRSLRTTRNLSTVSHAAMRSRAASE